MSSLPAMESFWMPFSAARNYRARPRLITSAKDMHYYDQDGRALLDACAGLWCCNAGHCREPIAEAIAAQAGRLDFAPTFQYAHPLVFEFSEKLADFFPAPLNSIFLTNSGSEAVDSALKIALAYQRIRGKGEKQILIGRERGYHGVGFGGISVGGIGKNRMWFGNQLGRVDHLPHTHDPRNLYARGEPEHGGEDFANALLRLIQLHDASNIAAVIFEPVAGSTGVLPPPKGYLKRVRQICDEHDILLIFDEVITSFGRLGKKSAAEFFGITPDLLTFAKGATSGAAPLGGVAVREDIRKTFLDAAGDDIDFFHGYTYSGHPLCVAAGLATIALYEDEGLCERGEELSEHFADTLHQLKGLPHVADIRTIGFMGAVELEPIAGKPGQRALDFLAECFHNEDIMVRVAGDTIALSPPLIMQKEHLDQIGETFARVLKKLA